MSVTLAERITELRHKHGSLRAAAAYAMKHLLQRIKEWLSRRGRQDDEELASQ